MICIKFYNKLFNNKKIQELSTIVKINMCNYYKVINNKIIK